MRKEIKTEICLFDKKYMPVYKHDTDSCADCKAMVDEKLGISIPAHSRCLVSLGFKLGIPEGYEVQLRPRSGMSKNGIDVALGTIDEGYKGEVKACVINNTDGPFDIHDGDRICQIKLAETPKMDFLVVDKLEDSDRGENGFGSTGIN